MKTKIILYVFLAAFFFATMEVTLKVAGSEMDPLQLTFLRFIIGGVFLVPFGLRENKSSSYKLKGKDYLWLLMLGILCIPVSMLLFQLGIMNSNASTAAVLMSVNPLFTMILAYFVLKESLNKRKMGGFLLGLIGIVFMIRPWNLQEGNTLLGAGLMLLAAITFGLYTVVGKIRLEKIGLFRQTCISFLMGSGVLMIFILLMERPILAGVVENIWLVLYIGVFVTGVGYYFYFMAIKYAGATTASIAFFIKPAMAPLFAVILLKDVILWNTYVGIGCILAASFISLMSGTKLKITGK